MIEINKRIEELCRAIPEGERERFDNHVREYFRAAAPPRPALEGTPEEEVLIWDAIHHLQADGALDRRLLCLGFSSATTRITTLSAQLINQKAEAYKFAYEAYKEIETLTAQLAEARTQLSFERNAKEQYRERLTALLAERVGLPSEE